MDRVVRFVIRVEHISNDPVQSRSLPITNEELHQVIDECVHDGNYEIVSRQYQSVSTKPDHVVLLSDDVIQQLKSKEKGGFLNYIDDIVEDILSQVGEDVPPTCPDCSALLTNIHDVWFCPACQEVANE